MEPDHRGDTAPAGEPLPLSTDEEQLMRTILEALRRIEYGSVQLVVQDSRVIQIDTVEKRRLH
jgi:hypothetical protein